MLFSNRAIFLRNGIPRSWLKKFNASTQFTANSYIYADWQSYKMGTPLATDGSYYYTATYNIAEDASTYALRLSNQAKGFVSASFYVSSSYLANNQTNGLKNFYTHYHKPLPNGVVVSMVRASLSCTTSYSPGRLGDFGYPGYDAALDLILSPGVSGVERRFSLGVNYNEIADQWCTVNYAWSTDYTDFSDWQGGTSSSIFGRILLETQSGAVYRCDQTDTQNYSEGDPFTTQNFNLLDASNGHMLEILQAPSVEGDYLLASNIWVLEGASFDPLAYYGKFSSGGLPRDPGTTVAGYTPDLRMKFNDMDNDYYTGGQIRLTPDVGLGLFAAADFIAEGFQQSTMDSLYAGNPYLNNITVDPTTWAVGTAVQVATSWTNDIVYTGDTVPMGSDGELNPIFVVGYRKTTAGRYIRAIKVNRLTGAITEGPEATIHTLQSGADVPLAGHYDDAGTRKPFDSNVGVACYSSYSDGTNVHFAAVPWRLDRDNLTVTVGTLQTLDTKDASDSSPDTVNVSYLGGNKFVMNYVDDVGTDTFKSLVFDCDGTNITNVSSEYITGGQNGKFVDGVGFEASQYADYNYIAVHNETPSLTVFAQMLSGGTSYIANLELGGGNTSSSVTSAAWTKQATDVSYAAVGGYGDSTVNGGNVGNDVYVVKTTWNSAAAPTITSGAKWESPITTNSAMSLATGWADGEFVASMYDNGTLYVYKLSHDDNMNITLDDTITIPLTTNMVEHTASSITIGDRHYLLVYADATGSANAATIVAVRLR